MWEKSQTIVLQSYHCTTNLLAEGTEVVNDDEITAEGLSKFFKNVLCLTWACKKMF